MFAKLLKYEWNSVKGLLLPLSLAALGLGALGGLMMWLLQTTSENAESDRVFLPLAFFGLVLVGIIIGLVAYAVAVWILLLYRFYKRHFSQEGYLTFTLPATTHQILLSSITNIVLWSLICIVTLTVAGGMILLPVIHLNQDAIVDRQTMQTFLEEFSHMYPKGYGAAYLFSVAASAVSALMLPLLCITVGSIVAKKHKLLASFGVYYGINVLISTVSGVLTAAGTIFSSDNNRILLMATVLPAVIQLCIGIGSYCIMHMLADKNLNLP